MKPEEQAYLDMELERRMQEVRDYVDDALTPFRNLTGVNGLKVTFSDSNVMIDADELQAGDGYGGNALAPIVGIDNGTGGTPDPNDPGEEFTPGDANTPGAAVVYEDRKRSAVASLLGFAEYTSPSTPAKKYRVRTASGSATSHTMSGASCSGTVTVVDTCTLWGVATYDVATGILTGSTVQNCYSNDAHVVVNSPVSGPFSSTFGRLATTTQTSSTTSLSEPLCSGTQLAVADAYYIVLTDEDTDIDAITRWRASPPAFSAWATATFPAASADYDARTTGFTFDYEEAEFRATYTGLPAGWPFKVKVRITKVTQATGAVSTVSNLVFTVVTNGSGGATISVSVIPLGSNADRAIVYEGGYTYRVQSVTHYL